MNNIKQLVINKKLSVNDAIAIERKAKAEREKKNNEIKEKYFNQLIEIGYIFLIPETYQIDNFIKDSVLEAIQKDCNISEDEFTSFLSRIFKENKIRYKRILDKSLYCDNDFDFEEAEEQEIELNEQDIEYYEQEAILKHDEYYMHILNEKTIDDEIAAIQDIIYDIQLEQAIKDNIEPIEHIESIKIEEFNF